MDIPRKPQRRFGPVIIIFGAGIALILSLMFALRPIIARNSGIVVDKSEVITDTVRLGTIERTVEGQGAFIPEDVRISSATEPGVVDRVAVKAGSYVSRGAVIARLKNPDLQASLMNTKS